VCIKDWNRNNPPEPWAYPLEWRAYVQNPNSLDEGELVYYRNILPLVDEPILVESNVPKSCDAMYFEFVPLVGVMILVGGLIIYLFALTALMIWSLVKGDLAFGTFMLTFLIALSPSIWPHLFNFNEENTKSASFEDLVLESL